MSTLAPEGPAAVETISLPLELTPELAELRDRARRFVDEVLIPHEEEAERLHGRLSQETIDLIKREAIAAKLNGFLHSPEFGGQGWTRLQWVLVEEQLGRSTNGVYWHIPNAYNVWDSASEAQRERYLRPAIAGELKDAYAVTEGEAGSDPSGIATVAERGDGGYRINGEKWFVTSGDVAQVLIVMANVVDGERRLPTLFLVESDAPGVEYVDDPPFTHNYPEGHPTIRFTDVEVTDDAVVGEVGAGDDLQRQWFTEERLAIAARGVGAMWRLLEETVGWACGREQGGARIYDYQGVSFPLADSAADAAAGRLLALSVATLADAGADPKIVHHKASMAKLFVSEAAWRCADRCVQAFGGRGYMRTNVAERFLRELRVDRIWEGTSEIQRLIVARGLERRGVERILH
jgi:alkylation response protein AidB-like acyl-CoA dehydrogenase